jgi:ABC-2 type transport system permease protein
MKRALFWKSLSDARWLLGCCALLLFVFHFLVVWIVSILDLPNLGEVFEKVLGPLGKIIERILPIPLSEMTSPVGMLSVSYTDPVVLFTATYWAISRGSDAVSGELDRGTFEMVLSQPISRLTALLIPALVTALGAAALVLAGWLGIALGLAFIDVGQPVSPLAFLPCAANLFAFTFFLAGLTTMVSSLHSYRWQTIGWVGGFYVAQLIIKVISRMGQIEWLSYFTFFGAYEPAVMATRADEGPRLMIQYNALYLVLGLACYALAALVFCRRDLPPPL